MKKTGFIPLLLLPLLLTGCENKDSSSAPSSTRVISFPEEIYSGYNDFSLPSTGVPTTSEINPTSNTNISSDDSDHTSSKSSSSTTVIESPAQKRLKAALNNMAKQDAIGVVTTSPSSQYIFDLTQSSSASDGETTSTTSKQFHGDIKLTNTTFNTNTKGLKETSDKNRVQGSVDSKSDVTLSLSKSEDNSTPLSVSKTAATLKSYLYNQNLYVDLDDTSTRDILKSVYQYLSDRTSLTDNLFLSMLPEYIRFDSVLSTVTLPISNFSTTDIDSIVDSLFSLYNNPGGQLALSITKDDTYTYIDLNLTSTILKALPLAYYYIAVSQLDSRSADYQSQVESIKKKQEILQKLVDGITITTFKIKLTFDDDGIRKIVSDIDLTLTDITLSNLISISNTYTLDNLQIISKKNSAFSFSDVTVLTPDTTNHNYVALTLPKITL